MQLSVDAHMKGVPVLAAPDINSDLFRAQMACLGHLRHPIMVQVSSDGPALKLLSRRIRE